MKKIVLLSFALSASMMMLASSAKSLNENLVPVPADGRIELVGPKAIALTSETAKLAANPVKAQLTKTLSTSIGTKAEGDLPFAYYSRPQGFFYWGLDPEYNYYPMPILLGAGYSEATWFNFSADATSYKWSYADPTDMTGATLLESTDKNLSVDYTMHFAQVPTLTATSSVGSTPFQMFGKNIETGAIIPALYGAGGAATLDNVSYTGVSSKDFSAGTKFYSTIEGGAGDWWFGTGPTAKGLGVIGMGLYMEQPVHSYALESMYVLARNFVAEPDAELFVKVYKLDSNGAFSEVIATGSCLAGDAVKMADDVYGGSVVTLPFAFVKEDELGLTEEIIPTIDSAIFVEFTGYQDPKVTSMSLVVAKDNMPNVFGDTGYFIYEDGIQPMSEFFEGDPMYTAPSMFLNIIYTWFETEEDNFVAPLAGGSKTFDVNAAYYSAGWTVEEEVDGTLPEWITYTAEDDRDTGISKLTFNVEPLPSGVEGRSFDVTVSIPGTTKVFKISQGSSGVNDAVVNSIKVTNVGGDFAVSYPATVSAVKIYNVSGQLVKDVALTEAGSSVIPAQELAKGVYIMQFNDNQSVKVIK